MQSLPKDHFIAKQIRRTSRNVIIGNMIVLLIASFVIFRQRHSLYNLLQGPFRMTPLEILQNQSYKSFYKIKTDYTLDGGVHTTDTLTTYLKIRMHVVKLKDAIKEHYVIGIIDNKPLLIEVPIDFKVPENNAGIEFQGVTYKFPGDASKFPEFYPFLFDSTGKPSGVNYWVLGICGLIILICIRYAAANTILLISPSMHRVFKRNGINDPASFSELIENELANKEVIQQGDIILTSSWLIRSNTSDLDVLPLSDIKWIYGEVGKEKERKPVKLVSENFSKVWIQSGTLIWDSEKLHIRTGRDNRLYSFSFADTMTAAKIIEGLLNRTVHFILGYSPELQKTWDEKRDELIVIVDSGKYDCMGILEHFKIDPAILLPSKNN